MVFISVWDKQARAEAVLGLIWRWATAGRKSAMAAPRSLAETSSPEKKKDKSARARPAGEA
jgi:hypothetical protein